jgi:hypothetical protein
MWYLGLAAIIALSIGAYFLFRDTLNRIQYIERLRLYWITKDTGHKGVPLLAPSFMRQTQAPYWHGTGVEARFFKWTFQVGILRGKGSNPIEFEELDVPVPTIRDWGRPDPKAEV